MVDVTAPSGLAAFAPRYDALLCDVWGVIHNGLAAHLSAVEALMRYRERGGVVVLITNAPRPSSAIIDRLDELGVPRSAYDAIVSSGDTTRAMVGRYAGKVVHHVGPPVVDDGMFEGFDIVRGPAEEADVVVVTDLDTDDDTPEMYDERMTLWLARGLEMICANPDKLVEHGGQLVYCGGALADVYAQRGGVVHMAGKPFAPIYEDALALAEAAAGRPLARERVLAVGDSVRTDATGAAAFGLDLLFITGSIHAEELDAFGSPDPQAVAELVAPSGARLAGFQPVLFW